MKISQALFTAFFLFCIALNVPPAYAQNTQTDTTDFDIYVKARDAKFIGDSVGGAEIIITDRRTGDVIMQGVTQGGTGTSEKLLSGTTARDDVLTDSAARISFGIDLYEPTPVTITARGPLYAGQNAVTVSQDYLLLPQYDYTSGNGIVLELGGMAVDILTPPPGKKLTFSPDATSDLNVNVMKLCGCTVAEDSYWPPERYRVEARIYNGRLDIGSFPLEFTGTPGLYHKDLKFGEPGTYRIEVTAFDSKTKEAGMATTTMILTK